MKPHPRIRKTIKWGGAVVTVLLVVVWIGSTRASVTWWGTSGYWCSLLGGRLNLGRDTPTLTGTLWHCHESPMLLALYYEYKGGREWTVCMPLWLPALCTVAASARSWRLDALARRRARLILCPKCGYSRAGIAGDAKCPECGATP